MEKFPIMEQVQDTMQEIAVQIYTRWGKFISTPQSRLIKQN
jgi:hypothetical protein